MPPRTALDPSVFAAVDRKSFSDPVASFQEIMVAPYRRISKDSPVGRTAETRELPCVMFTCACGGKPGEAGLIDRGFLLGRSTMLSFLRW